VSIALSLPRRRYPLSEVGDSGCVLRTVCRSLDAHTIQGLLTLTAKRVVSSPEPSHTEMSLIVSSTGVLVTRARERKLVLNPRARMRRGDRSLNRPKHPHSKSGISL